MLRWCSYCQSFIGEKPPYEDLTESHGICESCMARGPLKEEGLEKALRWRDRLVELKGMCRSGKVDEAFIQRATADGMKPFDLFAGMMQPLLYELGRRFCDKTISVADEHRATAVIIELVAVIGRQVPAESAQGPVDVLLFTADGNDHDLGLRMLSVLLRQEGIRVRTMIPGLPVPDLIAETISHPCRIMGLSLSLPAHWDIVHDLDQRLDADDAHSRFKLALGGSLLANDPVPAGIRADYIHDPMNVRAFIDWVKRTLEKH